MKVLVVDDDPVTRRILRQIITTELKGEVIEAANGMVALDTVSREAPDAVILDLQMPGFDGVETLATLRAWRHTKHLPVIVLTSQTDERIVRRCLSLQVTAYLAKPLQPEIVRDRLHGIAATLAAPRIAS
ncbi:MAG: response regulator [Vicinamibacterales bacterium]|nr:response regulator [Vicinamibacterales bacterium]